MEAPPPGRGLLDQASAWWERAFVLGGPSGSKSVTFRHRVVTPMICSIGRIGMFVSRGEGHEGLIYYNRGADTPNHQIPSTTVCPASLVCFAHDVPISEQFTESCTTLSVE
jgi:hypothetical protein